MSKYKWIGFWPFLIKGIIISCILIIINYIFCAFTVYQHSLPKPLHHADAAIILGAAAWDKHPSPVFRERINHALVLYKNNQVDKLIFTGGSPKADYMTEAAVGRRYAIKKGIDRADIIYENQSRDTWQNLVNAQTLAKDNNIDSFIIVSDPYHLARAATMAKDLGMKIQISPTPSSRYHTKLSKFRFLAQESYLLMIYNWTYYFTHLIRSIYFTF